MQTLAARILTALVILLAGTGGLRALHVAQAHGPPVRIGGPHQDVAHPGGACTGVHFHRHGDAPAAPHHHSDSTDHADCPLCQMLSAVAMTIPGRAPAVAALIPSGTLAMLEAGRAASVARRSTLARGPPMRG